MPARGATQQLTVTYTSTPGGPVVDPTGVTLTLLHDAAVVLGPLTTPTVVRDAPGLFRYEWHVPVDAPLGVYTAAWSGTLPGEDGPSVGYETVEVTDGLTALPPLPDSCWPVDTTCVAGWDAWAIDPDPDADPPYAGEPRYTPAQKALAVSLAGQTMRMLTGYRVGGCPITVRPCTRECYEVTWTGNGAGWEPRLEHGTWVNIMCGHTGCGCTGAKGVYLGQAGAVTEVRVDGLVLDPTTYRLDGGGLLVRTDGGSWPLTQDITAPDTEPGTWSVTYVPGVVVDGAGAAAAGVLAGEYVKACAGADDDCALPSGVTQIVRSGVTLSLTSDVFPEGRTGVVVVDAYVRRWNPYALAAPSTVWSPDVTRPRTTT